MAQQKQRFFTEHGTKVAVETSQGPEKCMTSAVKNVQYLRAVICTAKKGSPPSPSPIANWLKQKACVTAVLLLWLSSDKFVDLFYILSLFVTGPSGELIYI